jgi:hypothetical protein
MCCVSCLRPRRTEPGIEADNHAQCWAVQTQISGLSLPRMRFRAKSGSSWIWLLMAGFWVVLWIISIRPPHPLRSGNMPLIWIALCSINFFLPYITYWEMDAEGLRERKLWWTSQKTRWQDVTRIISLWSSSHDLKIEYDRLGLGSNFGHIMADPADREAFLDALSRFAPQAEFVVWSSGRFRG